jgi:replicative DNA helicase
VSAASRNGQPVAPPQNLEAEQSVLGAVLLSDTALPAVIEESLRPEDFYREGHGRIYRAMLDLHTAGEPIDALTLTEHLKQAGDLEAVGGRAAIDMLAGAVPAVGNVRQYARIVRDNAMLRRLLGASYEIQARVESNGAPPRELVVMAEKAITGLLEQVPDRAVDRTVDGAQFILDGPAHVPAVWGAGEEVLWAEGEPLMVYAPQGVGKTTIAQQLALARIGLRDQLLDLPVAADDRRVLYLACDRPNQARRSLRRMVTEADRARLAEQLVVWTGPLPFDVVREPRRLAAFALEREAGTLIIDSLKDIAVGLADDAVGSAVNIAIQHVISAGIEVCDLHHPRKSNAANPKPKALDDVYGSTWLTAGHGSIVLLWGKAGDLVVEFEHKKHPADEVSPFKVAHDHATGRSRRHRPISLLEQLRDAADGLTVRDAAVLMFGSSSPEDNEIEKARRKLRALEDEGKAELREPGGPRQPGRYFPTVRGLRGLAVTPEREPTYQPTDSPHPAHAEPTEPTESPSAPLPLLKESGPGTWAHEQSNGTGPDSSTRSAIFDYEPEEDE